MNYLHFLLGMIAIIICFVLSGIDNHAGGTDTERLNSLIDTLAGMGIVKKTIAI